MKKMVSVIIVNWNGLKYLQECLKSLEKINYRNCEIIIVDNNSSDGSQEFIKKNYPETKIIQNNKNLGFAEANNRGYEKTEGEYVLLLNNDTIVEKDFLSPLVEYLDSHPEMGVVQPKILLWNNPTKIQLVGSYLINSGFLYYFGYEKDKDRNQFDKPIEIFSAVGACMLIRRDVIKKVGLFDNDFFAYFEETDFCWRVWLAGYKIVYLPQPIIYHKGAATSSLMAPSFIQFHSFKNRICSHLKNLDTPELLKILSLHLFFVNCVSAFYFLTGKWRLSCTLQKSIWWNIFNIKSTWAKRKIVQNKIRRISDKGLMPQIKKRVPLRYHYYYFFKGLEEYND